MVLSFKKVVKQIADYLLPKKYVLFESKPDFADSSFMVYDYMKNHDMFGKYRPVWIVSSSDAYRNGYKCIAFERRTLKEKLNYIYVMLRSKAFVYTNRNLNKCGKRQLVFSITHGTPIKSLKGKYECGSDVDYYFIQGSSFRDLIREDHNVKESVEIVSLGYPRNDDFLAPCNVAKEDIFGNYKKIIVWFPTFRKQLNAGGRGSAFSHQIPFIYDEDNCLRLNKVAQENDTLIVLKPHFAADTSTLTNHHLSNILLIDDNFCEEKGIRPYQMLKISDALLTDYSSVYFDYLLVDKPIGLIWEDWDEYVKYEGIIVEKDKELNAGERIYTIDELCSFIERISAGVDLKNEERRACNLYINDYVDSESSKRVAEFICNKINNR